MPPVKLDRMDVDDVATSVDRIAAEIHRQLGDTEPPVPVYEIARALDILEIREAPARNYEAMLLTNAEREFGQICVNTRNSSAQRRRYSVGHELGHFLCTWHRQVAGDGFKCSRQDMATPTGDEVHIRQEREANWFAIELLAPKRMLTRYLNRLPDLEQVLAIHSALQISKTAAARRYANLHREPLAVVFATNGLFQYADRGPGFPFINLERGEPLPWLPSAGRDGISEMVDADPKDWRGLEWTNELSVQMFQQEDGHSIVLLHRPLTDTGD